MWVIDMKQVLKPSILPRLTLACGILGLVLQLIFFSTGVDDKGLLPSAHWAETCSWGLTIFMMVLLLLGVRDLGGIPKYDKLFPQSLPAAIGTILGGLGVGIAGLRLLAAREAMLSLATGLIGCACALLLIVQGICRFRGKQLPSLTRIPVTLFCMLHLLCRYRVWSGSTQLQEYGFSLLASVFLMLACYQRAALENKLSGRRIYTLCRLAACFFAFLAAARDPLYYFPAAIWMLTDSCSLRILPKKQSQAEEE